MLTHVSAQDESTRLSLDLSGTKEKIKDNKEKIKFNKQLPYLVGNIVEILDINAEEEVRKRAIEEEGEGTKRSKTTETEQQRRRTRMAQVQIWTLKGRGKALCSRLPRDRYACPLT